MPKTGTVNAEEFAKQLVLIATNREYGDLREKMCDSYIAEHVGSLLKMSPLARHFVTSDILLYLAIAIEEISDEVPPMAKPQDDDELDRLLGDL